MWGAPLRATGPGRLFLPSGAWEGVTVGITAGAVIDWLPRAGIQMCMSGSRAWVLARV